MLNNIQNLPQSNFSNNPSFKGKIVFTSPEKFAKVFNEHITESNFVDKPWNLETVKKSSDWVGTSDINTCTAMVLDSGESLMAHFMTSVENFEKLDIIKNLIKQFKQENPIKSVLLVGSKSPNVAEADLSHLKGMLPESYWHTLEPTFNPKSSELFNELHPCIQDLNPTVLCGHKNPNTSSHIVHDSKNDTSYICTYIDNVKQEYVKNSDDIAKAYEKISISPNDTVEFWA